MTPGSLVVFQHPYYIASVDGVIAIPNNVGEKPMITGLFIKDLGDGTADVLYEGTVLRIIIDTIEKEI